MRVSKKGDSTFTRGDGVFSGLLQTDAGEETGKRTELTVTWVEVKPGAKQKVHSHEPEQVYVIVRGKGKIQVGNSEKVLRSGDSARIPPNTRHGIENSGDEVLEYVSATTPAFPKEKVREFYKTD